MKIRNFDYTKKNSEETSKREILQLHDTNDWIDGIDFTKLDEEEREIVLGIQTQYEEDMKPFMKKAFRRFLKEGIKNESKD